MRRYKFLLLLLICTLQPALRLSAQGLTKVRQDTTEVASKNKSAPAKSPAKSNGNFGDDDQNNPSTGGDSTGIFGDADQSSPTTDGNANGGFSDSDMGSIPLAKRGDVNGDGTIANDDVTDLVNIILGKQANYDASAADVNDDGQITIADVTALVNMIRSN